MKNIKIKIKQLACLLLITVIILASLTQYVIKVSNRTPFKDTETSLRIRLSNSIAFMKDNWENLSEDSIKNELTQKLTAADVEAAVYDNKTQQAIFSCGEYAKNTLNSSNDEVFGLNSMAAQKDGYLQLNWLIYRQDTLLGAIKLYIPEKSDENSGISNPILWVAAVTIVFLLILMWVFYFLLQLNQKYQVIHALNTAIKRLSQGGWDVPITCASSDDEISESLQLLDRTRQDLKDMFILKEKNEASRKILVNYLMHDIRTPVASLRALTEGLIDGIPRTEEAKKDYYEGIMKKISELEKLTDDLFFHVNIEASAIIIRREEVYCDEALRPVLNSIHTIKFRGSLEIDYDIPHVLVSLDTPRIEQAIINLVTNAIKYSKDNGSIKISITREENMVVIQVEDDGLGISKEDLPFIFEHFFRGEKSRSRQYGGTGLGLSIVKYIVEAHDGYINVKSELGRGSLFKIYIPLS